MLKTFTGDTKQSAKGVTRDARQRMTHELYKQVLLGGETVRLLNTRIASSKHQLMTVVTNKKSLSGYDDKRYICPDKLTTLPFGHKQLQDEMFARQITCNPEWGSSDESDNEVLAESSMEQSPPPTQYTPQTELQEFWSPPDPGLNQRSYSDDELEEDLIDFELLSEQDDFDHDRCLFIDDEAEESDRSESFLDICSTSEVFSLENPPDAPRKKQKCRSDSNLDENSVLNNTPKITLTSPKQFEIVSDDDSDIPQKIRKTSVTALDFDNAGPL